MTNSTRKPLGHVPVRAALVVLLAFGAAACAGKKKPEPIPSQTATQAGPQLEPPPQLPPPIRQVRPTQPTTVKVIDPGGEAEEPQSLYEASQRAKALERTRGPAEPIAEITDENLHEYSARAEVIMVEGEPAAPAPSLAPSQSPEATAGQEVRDEQYWRNGALELRMAWRRTLDRIDDLELEAAALRQQFYAEDDPYVRDSHVKPEWDRALDRLNQLRDRAQRYEQELEVFLEEGRRSGVPPGWLSEGWELEPESRAVESEEPDPFATQSGEPQILEEVIDP